ncbi:uncharacterized protein STAUR_7954 [Stigmatella aurantiaca DW4/3-1]|uniref:Uncharacterized protein n=1 Tax=Stigmatella aurantiaca (strain DW4/3-1) TaxID=378806 RepID=E3FQ06_STIAD|nr:uncharacterized protein STAUR_7954 [Stigmatella aurantiaca DW4/3-1]
MLIPLLRNGRTRQCASGLAARSCSWSWPVPRRSRSSETRSPFHGRPSLRQSLVGWVVQLPEAPLDLDIPAHVEALRCACEHFPAIGGRIPPSEGAKD